MKIPLLNIFLSTGGGMVINVLNNLGVKFIFTLPGSQTLPIMQSAYSTGSPKVVVSRSERNSVFMAEGYGAATGTPACVLSTLGPGVANELPALYSAMLSYSPVLSITPAQPPWKLNRLGEVFQGLHHQKFINGFVKETYTINGQEEIIPIIQKAYKKCVEKPAGPVHVGIPFPLLFKPCLFYGLTPKTNNQESPDICIIHCGIDIKWLFDYLESTPDKKEFQPGDPSGLLPFSLGVKFAHPSAMVVTAISMSQLLNNLDSITVASSHGVKTEVYSSCHHDGLYKISKIFKINYNIGNTFFKKSNTFLIWVYGEK